MQRGGLYFMCLALCCLHNASDTHRVPEDNPIRRRRSDEKDSLALSREIFRNITKKLRENFKSEATVEINQPRILQSKVEESRNYAPYQEYHHHERHWGPYFEEKNVTQNTAHVGSEALLNCRVVMLKDKTVMWLRNTTDVAQLLTVGREAHAGDNRVSLKFQYPNNWRISINPVKQSDEGLYMCQISTHPPRIIYANLTVLPPVLTINGDKTHEVKDRFYKKGSSIKLTCLISEEYVLSMSSKHPVSKITLAPTTPMTTTIALTTRTNTVYNKIDLMINKSWSVETTTITSTVSVTSTNTPELKNLTEPVTTQQTTQAVVNNIYGLTWRKQGRNYLDHVTWRNLSATISVMSASQNDSGMYTCHLQNHSQVTTNVHVLIGENQAAVYHDTWNKGSLYWQPRNISMIFILLLQFLM